MLDLTAPTLWWLVAGALVLAELLTGTFYLLMLAAGAAAGALAAHLGAGLTVQILVAAVAGGGGVTAWHLLRQRKGLADTQPDPLALDVGNIVHVAQWQADGTARVQHRGSSWDARLARPGQAPQPGQHVIKGLHANQLLLERCGVD